MDLTPEVVFNLVHSENQFPIDFDDAWKWIGYSRKDNAKIALLGAGFLEDKDFRVFLNDQENSRGGRPSEKITLTIDCFKSFCMMAGTDRGRAVRRYFLDCESELKRRIAKASEDHVKRVEAATLKVYTLESPVSWSARGRIFQQNFYDAVYRIKAKTPLNNPNQHPIWMAATTIDLVYERLQPGLWDDLCAKNPRVNGRRKFCCHQFLSENIGNVHLRHHLYAVTKMMNGYTSWGEFKYNLDKCYPKTTTVQMDILFDLFSNSPDEYERWHGLVS